MEVGSGQGELIGHVRRLGFDVSAFEPSLEAAEITRQRLRGTEAEDLVVFNDPDSVPIEGFHYLVALEVLEHIRDDRRALKQWNAWLRPNGRLLISVPAYMSKWSVADEYGGHYRRYERDELGALLMNAGFTIDRFWNYGFPLTAITGIIRPYFYGERMKNVEHLSHEERSYRSSLDSTRSLGSGAALVSLVLEGVGRAAHWIQLPFRYSGLGDGFFVIASKK